MVHGRGLGWFLGIYLGYPLVMTNSSPWKIANLVRWFTVLQNRWIFHGELLVITRWYPVSGRDHGHLWPYHPVTCDPIIPGHLRPYYPVTCDPIPLITLTPPAFHHTIVSILLLYLNFPPCVPLYHCLHSTSLFKLPPPCVPLYHCLRSISSFKLHPPRVPLYHCLHSTSLFKLPPPVSILLLYLNFPPCVPLNHCLHSTSLFKLPPPAFHYTIVPILFLHLNFTPPVFHYTIVSILLLYLNFPPLSPFSFYFFI